MKIAKEWVIVAVCLVGAVGCVVHLDSLFKKMPAARAERAKIERPALELPAVGSLWVYEPDGNPFKRDATVFEVVAVSTNDHGYVQKRWRNPVLKGFWVQNSGSLASFNVCFVPAPKVNQ